MGPFFSYWVASPRLDLRVRACSYCILLCCVQLISLGGLSFFFFFFFWRETEEQWNWERGGAEVGLREREEGGCSLDLLCVRIIKKEGRKKPQKTGETFLEQQTDSLPSLLERYFQIPCDWKNEWTNAWGTTQRGWTFLQGQQSLWCMCISRKALFARTSLQCSKGGKRTRV